MSSKKSNDATTEQDSLIRIAIVNPEKCKPSKCRGECKKSCPVVKTGQQCIIVSPTSPIASLSEALCIGCGICVKKCPFGAIQIINIPASLNKDTTHRYGSNSFKLHRLPMPRPGEVLGLVGSNGTGKSTALQILSGAIKPNLGNFNKPPEWKEILANFRGSELQNYFTKILQDELKATFKPQYVDKIPKSVQGKVSDILRKRDERGVYDQVIHDMELVQLQDREIDDLSGGELQRFAIATAVVSKAEVYMFDEPSSYLDIKQRLHAAWIIRSMTEVSKGNTYVLCVEHDLSVLDYLSDYICVLYGEPGAYGVVTAPYSVREGINIFLQGFVPTENLRFRTEALTFRVAQSGLSVKFGGIVEEDVAGGAAESTATATTTATTTTAGSGKKKKEFGSTTTSVNSKDETTTPNTSSSSKSNNKKKSTDNNKGADKTTTTTTDDTTESEPTTTTTTTTTPQRGVYRYPTMKKILRGEEQDQKTFELQVMGGEFRDSEIVVMLGENGTGKTTFIRMLAGYLAPDMQPGETTLPELPKLGMSYKPQKISPKFEGSVRELLQKRILAAFNHPQFSTDVLKPMKIEAILDNEVKFLSGGELQRVALTVCLGTPAEIYLIDEPSAYLDSEQRVITAKMIKRFIIHAKKTAFIVEHDFIMSTYLADRVVVYEGQPGVKATANSPQDLLTGMNKFLEQLNTTFRRDPSTNRPRINKKNSVKDQEQKKAGTFFFIDDE
jgi:ATP-binding cassette subfamily E protein 1